MNEQGEHYPRTYRRKPTEVQVMFLSDATLDAACAWMEDEGAMPVTIEPPEHPGGVRFARVRWPEPGGFLVVNAREDLVLIQQVGVENGCAGFRTLQRKGFMQEYEPLGMMVEVTAWPDAAELAERAMVAMEREAVAILGPGLAALDDDPGQGILVTEYECPSCREITVDLALHTCRETAA